MMTSEPTVTMGSGNVYEDLGLPDAKEMKIKSMIALEIQRVLTKRNLTQVEAAALMGIDQPKTSAILNGKFRGFTIDRMIRFLEALDVEVLVSFVEREAS